MSKAILMANQVGEKQINIGKVWGDLGLNDNGKLLFTYYSSSEYGGPEQINNDLINFYIFILRLKNIVPFNYEFRFDPYPYSEMLQEDIHGLLHAGYLEENSPIKLSAKGREFVNRNMHQESVEQIFMPVARELNSMAGLDSVGLIHEVYKLLSIAS
jgi:hypothetical protein